MKMVINTKTHTYSSHLGSNECTSQPYRFTTASSKLKSLSMLKQEGIVMKQVNMDDERRAALKH